MDYNIHSTKQQHFTPPFKTLLLVILAGIIMNACYHIKSPKLIDIFNLLANYSFGIYFLHQYIINLLAILVVRLGGDYRSLTYSLAIFPLVVCLSVLGVYFIKITVGSSKSRLLIGS
jgi:peptidoglycan/LPS O-acetylase OafA/YrhL